MCNACGLNQPTDGWRTSRLAGPAGRWLKTKNARNQGLALICHSLRRRLWISDWGDHNFPAGEIFTSPVEDSVNGHVEFSFPTVFGGREVNGVKLSFKDGKVIEASAAKGEAYLLQQLDMDEGARRLGEFAIGTNYGIQKFTGGTLFDEKIGGTVHMALGEAIKEANGQNSSAIHWDIVHEMKNGGEIVIDGTLFYRSGQFMIGGA
jgi:aminopeptidase